MTTNEFDAYFETLLSGGEDQAVREPKPHDRETAHAVQEKPRAEHQVRANSLQTLPAVIEQDGPTSGWERVKTGYPVSIARSALFAVGDHGEEELKNVSIEASNGINILYSGPRLNQRHALVFQALSQISQGASEDIVVSHTDILKMIGVQESDWRANQRLRALISDMSKSHITLDTALVRYEGVLIHGVGEDKLKGMLYLSLNHKLARLFENAIICERPEIKAAIGNGQLSLWLHSYISSHFKPFPVSVMELRRICGYRKPPKKFRYELRQAAQKLMEGPDALLLSWSINQKDQFIYEKRATKVTMLKTVKPTEKKEEMFKSDGAVQRARSQRAKVAL